MKIDRTILLKIHLILAASIFPITLFFMLTGLIFTWELSSSYNSTIYPIQLTHPIPTDEAFLKRFVIKELTAKHLKTPEGKLTFTETTNSWSLKWRDGDILISLDNSGHPLLVHLSVKKPNFFRKMAHLHKAESGFGFKIYATFFSSALILILFSGFLMAWQIPKYRTITLTASIVGIVIFIIMVITH